VRQGTRAPPLFELAVPQVDQALHCLFLPIAFSARECLSVVCCPPAVLAVAGWTIFRSRNQRKTNLIAWQPEVRLATDRYPGLFQHNQNGTVVHPGRERARAAQPATNPGAQRRG